MNKRMTLALIGNPNSGKTTLFNALTGSKQRVGNWPGVTVEKKMGKFFEGNDAFRVVDLPGIYSLDVVNEETSLDERVSRDYVHSGEADLVVNIVDASNLERNLFLSAQLIEMGLPLVIVLNMMDMAEAKGVRVDAKQLEQDLGCPVLPIVASEGKGIAALKRGIADATAAQPKGNPNFTYAPDLERVIENLKSRISALPLKGEVSPRWLAVRLLEGDHLARQQLGKELADIAEESLETLSDDVDILVADARYSFTNKLAKNSQKLSGKVARDMTDKIDRIILNRALGIPLFLLMMYLMFMFTIQVGGAFIDFFDQAAGAIFVDGVAHLMQNFGAPAWLTVLLSDGIGGGIQTVATFVPIVASLFLFLSFLEDSGYMARAAFVMDRFMRWLGLPGKAFVPLIVGFGCTVPAIMATRTLDQRRDRLMTMAMSPFMSCGARLPVYVLFGAAFFPHYAQNMVFSLYLIGILVAVVTGLILKNSLLKGEAVPFVMELPAYHMPTVKGIFVTTWGRLKSFIVHAGRIIVPLVLILNVMNSMGTDGSFGNEDSDHSVLAAVGKTITPAFSPMGIEKENWPAAVGIFTGILAKEAVVGTLDSAYTAIAKQESGNEEEAEAPFSLASSLWAAVETIPDALGGAFGAWGDPLGIDVGELSDKDAAAESQEVSIDTFGAMAARFDGAGAAFAYLLFILLYFPCSAAIAAIYQESGVKWSLFVGAWTTGVAYALSTICYQSASFSSHPLSSSLWIGGMASVFVATFIGMRVYAKAGEHAQ